MTRYPRVYVPGFGAFIFLALLLLLWTYLPSEPRPNAIHSSHWPPHQNLSKQQDSGRVTWKGTDWSQFAYVQPDRLMMYPAGFSLDDNSTEARLLKKARIEYGVILKPIEVQRRTSHDPTWAESYTKLLAFNQTEYRRVLHLDSDSTVLQSMDELFLLEPAWVAMPRAYWLGFEGRVLSSQLLLLQPSADEFDRVMRATEDMGDGDYDMDILNTLYRDSAMILPHSRYDLLTGEFRGDDHEKYLQGSEQRWDPDTILKEAKYLHFSDWPLPKPWLANPDQIDQSKPPCHPISSDNYTKDCRDQHIWVRTYTEFRRRRKEVCEFDVWM